MQFQYLMKHSVCEKLIGWERSMSPTVASGTGSLMLQEKEFSVTHAGE